MSKTFSISEKQFLNEYRRFTAIHRWTIAKSCLAKWKALDSHSTDRAHLALEILFSYFLLIEDILIWYYVLKELQRPSRKHLMDILNDVNLRPNTRSTSLEELQKMTDMEFMSLLGVSGTPIALDPAPSTAQYQVMGAEIRKILLCGIRSFTGEGESGIVKPGTFGKCLNKIKHGLLVMRMEYEQQESVFIFPYGTNLGFATDQSSIPSIANKEESLQKIYEQITWLTRAFVGLLTILFLTLFQESPEGAPPDELNLETGWRSETESQ